jgi:hypothetical protein
MNEPTADKIDFGPQPVQVGPLTDADAAAICARAFALGLDCTRVDLSGCTEKRDLLARLAKALGFPAWFGHNWDALADCMTDLGWRPAEGYVLILEHGAELRESQPEVFDTTLAILDDAAVAWKARGATFRTFVSVT